ncbi:hypothetical protein AB1K84_18505 [Mesobacillus foraminis]|uniref:hypothetical protein n=1 Tax=Mesobacillus foraminis TaxID=279826 RepID=UPI0039A09CAF
MKRMNYYDHLNELKGKLQSIEKALLEDSFKEPMLSVLLNVLIEEIRELDFKYEVPFVLDKNKYHFYSYINFANKYKSKLLVDLQELQYEMNRKNTNKKRSLALLQGMIETDLYTSHVKKKINKWVNTTGITVHSQAVYTDRLKGVENNEGN